MKVNILSFFSILFFTSSIAQCDIDLTIFNNQEDVNNFANQHPDCVYAHFFSFKTDAITDLSPLSYINSINHLLIIDADNITSLMAFDNTEILSSLIIRDSDGLLNLDGIHLYDSQEYSWLVLENNSLLENIEALDDVNTAIETVTIMNNPNLSQCAVSRVCKSLTLDNTTISIANNNTGCNSREEVENECEIVGINDFELNKKIILYPNPASNIIKITTSAEIDIKDVKLYNQLGQLLSITSNKTIDIIPFENGVYFIKVSTSKGNITKKVIKR